MHDVHTQGLLHRVVHLIVVDESDRILLQKRGPDVATHPNLWDFSAGGHVDEGEDYAVAALRELQEELGLTGFDLHELDYSRLVLTTKGLRLERFVKLFEVTVPVDIPITIEPAEVSEARWFTEDEVRQLLVDDPAIFTPHFIESLETYYLK